MTLERYPGLTMGDGTPFPPKKPRWPQPTQSPPDVHVLCDWEMDGGCEATDGCWVEPDGICEHGHPSWLLIMGLI